MPERSYNRFQKAFDNERNIHYNIKIKTIYKVPFVTQNPIICNERQGPLVTFQQRKELFERTAKPAEAALLTFHGVEGFDVYNCSIPFMWHGCSYIYGRVERRGEWARSWVRLFEQTGQDEYTLIPDGEVYPLEDPFISFIHGELVLGGTHVQMRAGSLDTFFGYFYKGTDLHNLYYFTTGPQGMKDIRLLQTPEGIGVFSRHRNAKVRAQHGSDSVIGFTVIQDILQLTAGAIEDAPVIQNMFAQGEWGGCNQCYALDSGMIGIIGHKSYGARDEQGGELSVYTNVSFVFDPRKNAVVDEKILATRCCFPDAPAKRPTLRDCAFTTGIVMRKDGRADLYSGLGDTMEGRLVIDAPFRGFGRIIENFS